jgi:hypothetical protein
VQVINFKNLPKCLIHREKSEHGVQGLSDAENSKVHLFTGQFSAYQKDGDVNDGVANIDKEGRIAPAPQLATNQDDCNRNFQGAARQCNRFVDSA